MSKSRDLKAAKIKDLADKFNQAKVVVLADHTGLKVAQINDLRAKIKAAGGNFTVAKNTLLKLALGNSQLPARNATRSVAGGSIFDSQLSDALQGPTAVVFATGDDITPLKALVQFARTAGLPSIKTGVANDQILTAAEINQMASLPSKEILLAKLLGLLNAPVANLTYVLQANNQKLAYIISQIAKNKPN